MSDGRLFDCIGVGAGPSNLSLACFLAPVAGFETRLLEREPVFGWHDGLLPDNAALQTCFVKDLVSPVDPTSAFSFLNFLRHKGRLYQFLNARFPSVPRAEFRQYLGWVCEQLGNVEFSCAVEDVRFDGDFVVATRDRELRARNIVVGVGHKPYVPRFAEQHLAAGSVLHSSRYREVRGSLGGRSVAVVGGGQSGAEVFLDLISADAASAPVACMWLSRRPNFLPLDDSPFTNELFTPTYSSYFFALSPASRHHRLSDQKLASDGISEETLAGIYRALYRKKFLENCKTATLLCPNRSLTALHSTADGWQLVLTQNESMAVEILHADVVILATGYEYHPPEFLDGLAGRLERAGRELRINDDFSVPWDGPATNKIFVQNGARRQRGIADPNLSLLAWRSAKIVNSLLCRRLYSVDEDFPLVDWTASSRDVRVGVEQT